MRKRWQFTKKGLSSFSSNTKGQSKTGTSSYKLYRNIADLPLVRFIDAYVDNNLSVLVIEGNPPEQEINEAWFDIRVQYADAIGDTNFRNYATVKGQVANLEITNEKARILITELSMHYCTQLHDRLNKLFNYKFNLPGDNYEGELKRAEKRAGGWRLELSMKQAAVAKMEKKMGDGGQVSREYFQGLKLTIHTHFKVSLIDEKTTTWEFCELLNRIRKEIETGKTKR